MLSSTNKRTSSFKCNSSSECRPNLSTSNSYRRRLRRISSNSSSNKHTTTQGYQLTLNRIELHRRRTTRLLWRQLCHFSRILKGHCPRHLFLGSNPQRLHRRCTEPKTRRCKTTRRLLSSLNQTVRLAVPSAVKTTHTCNSNPLRNSTTIRSCSNRMVFINNRVSNRCKCKQVMRNISNSNSNRGTSSI